MSENHDATRLRAFHVTTLEKDRYGREHLGWALIPAIDHTDAARRTKRRWPEVVVMACSEVAI